MYALIVDKNGPKFKEANLNFRRIGQRQGEVRFGMGAMGATKQIKGPITMAALARILSNSLDRPVQDFTGLTGTYDIDLSWAPDAGIDRQSPSAAPYSAAQAASGDLRSDVPAAPAATIFTAIRDSLGLKLEARKEPVEALVIDHVERIPTEN